MAGGDAGSQDVVFSRPFRAAGELENLERVLRSDHSHGDGVFTASATARLREITGSGHVLLTTSCTHALEMASMLLDLGPGDEVVLPTFTFPSAATAIVTRGATPVFADIDPRTGNLDPESAAEAVTERTRAISVMHYGGVAADLDALEAIARPRGIPIIEDNAHGLGGVSAGRRLGTEGAFGAQSFHDTKNVHCGEGGALLINDERYVARAEIIREKGTDRSRFLRGAVDKYSWQDVGSSYLPSELNAAVLDAQLAAFEEIQRRRHSVWDAYAAGLADWAGEHGVDTMSATPGLEHSAHLYYLLLPEHHDQQTLIEHLKARGVRAAFHYIPLDSAPAGLRYGRTVRPLERAARFHDRLVRLPLWAGMTDAEVERVLDGVRSFRPR